MFVLTVRLPETLYNFLSSLHDIFTGSSFQVVDYNATTGAVIAQRTVQGYSNSSTWSRGQAWGVYGFANSR